MKRFKLFLKWISYFLLIPATYFIISFMLSAITVNKKVNNENSENLIYLHTNGVHLDMVIPIENIDSLVLSGIKRNPDEKFISFGWGDENFYINTPTWGDLTFSNVFNALFLKSSSLMHITRYKSKHPEWIEIKTSEVELEKLNFYLQNSFKTNEKGMKIILKNKGYSSIDDFYKAKGSYSMFYTCNSWVNDGFKESGLKSCVWTPFDFGLMNKYE